MTAELDGLVVVVTGSTDGIGRAVVLGAAAGGATVVVNGRRQDRVTATVAEVERDGGRALGVPGDVTDERTVTALTDGVVERLGRLDVLVNNVGGGAEQRLADSTLADFDRVHDRNLRSVYRLTMAALPHLRSSPSPRVVNVTSIAGRFWSRLSGVDYASAKAGVHGLTRQLAHDLAGEGITVNAVAPGIIATDRALAKFDRRPGSEQEAILATTPMRRFGTPDEVAWDVLAFASPRASYATGATLDVNGGAFLA